MPDENPYTHIITDHMREYERWMAQEAKKPQRLTNDDAPLMWEGYFTSIGFHVNPETNRLVHRPVYDKEWRVTLFPFLTNYWTRPGVVHIEDGDLANIYFGTLKHRIYSCLQEADRRGELLRLIDPSKVKNLRALLDRTT